MTTRVSTQDEQAEHRLRTPLVLTVLTLAVLSAFALWQLRPGGEEATPAADSAAARSGTTATAAAPAVVPRDLPTPTIYLVASQAQAQVVSADLEEANAVQVTSGEPMLASQILWFDSIEAEAFFWSTMGVQQGRHVVDRRTPAARVPEPGLALVVATDEEAAAVYSDYIERLHALDGATPIDVTVVVDGAVATTAPSGYGACNATIGPADC